MINDYLSPQWTTNNRVINLEIYLEHIDRSSREYILQHHHELLPDWISIPETIVFILFQCRIPLDGSNLSEEETEKEMLWEISLQVGKQFYQSCRSQNIMAEVICPKTGYPLYSQKGSKNFHLSPLITRYIPSFKQDVHSCSLIHPRWQKAVYPSIMFSNASGDKTRQLIMQLWQ